LARSRLDEEIALFFRKYGLGDAGRLASSDLMQ
jgi:hypothetical protein